MTKESKHEKEEREERELEQEHKKELERQRKIAEHNREALGVDVNHSSDTKKEPEKPKGPEKPLSPELMKAVQDAEKLIPTSPKLLDYPEVGAVMIKAADYSMRQLMARSPGMSVAEALASVVSQLLVGYPDVVSQVTGNQPVNLPSD